MMLLPQINSVVLGQPFQPTLQRHRPTGFRLKHLTRCPSVRLVNWHDRWVVFHLTADHGNHQPERREHSTRAAPNDPEGMGTRPRHFVYLTQAYHGFKAAVLTPSRQARYSPPTHRRLSSP